MTKGLIRGAYALLICAGIVAISSGHGFAAASVTNNTNTLKIAPVRSNLTVEPGTTGTVKMYITNVTKSPIVIHPIENDFVAGDEAGTPSIILDENSYAPTHSLKRFMVPLSNFTVQPGEAKEVDLTVTVPKTVQAGGYYGAVRFAPAQADGGVSVNLSASVASLILMQVPGPTYENLLLTNFDIQQYGSTVGILNKADGVSLLIRFANKGNLQEAPFGQINIQKGKKVVYTYNFNRNSTQDYILPDGARRWTVPLKNLQAFGKYKISGTFTYGTAGKSISVAKTIWVIPNKVIIAGLSILGGIILLALLTWFLLKIKRRRSSRKSKRHYRV